MRYLRTSARTGCFYAIYQLPLIFGCFEIANDFGPLVESVRVHGARYIGAPLAMTDNSKKHALVGRTWTGTGMQWTRRATSL